MENIVKSHSDIYIKTQLAIPMKITCVLQNIVPENIL